MNRRRFLKASLAATGAAAGMANAVASAAEKPAERPTAPKDPIMPDSNSAARPSHLQLRSKMLCRWPGSAAGPGFRICV